MIAVAIAHRPGSGSIRVTLAAITLLLLLVPARQLLAQEDSAGHLYFEGYLEDEGGVPVDGDLAMTFAIYNAAEGGDLLWTEQHQGGQRVQVVAGHFGVYLGRQPDAPLLPELFAAGPRYLSVTVDGTELRPRRELAGAAYALHAGNAATLAGLDTEALLAEAMAQCVQTLQDRDFVQHDDLATVARSGRYQDLLGLPELAGFVTAEGAVAAVANSGQFVQVGGDQPLQGDLDLNGHELRNPVIHNAAEAPADPAPGQLWFDSSSGVLMSWNGEAWIELGANPQQVAAALIASEEFRTQVVQQLVAQHLEQLRGPRGEKGEPGQDADPAAVAGLLVQNPGFVQSVVQKLFEQHREELRGPPGEGLQNVDTELLSSVFSQQIWSEDTPLRDPQDGQPVVSALQVPVRGTIREVRVALQVAHPAISELVITLTSPAGTVVTLHHHEAGAAGGLSVSFPDERAPSIGSMQDFLGEEAEGEWELALHDQTVGNVGTILDWNLTISYFSGEKIRIGSAIIVQGGQISGVTKTIADDDAASKKYVDTAIQHMKSSLGIPDRFCYAKPSGVPCAAGFSEQNIHFSLVAAVDVAASDGSQVPQHGISLGGQVGSYRHTYLSFGFCCR